MSFNKLLTQSITWRGFYFLSVLLVNVFLSRYLQASSTGNLYFITIIFSFMQVLLSMGVEPGTTYFASSKIIERNKLFAVNGVWAFTAAIIMVALIRIFFLVDASMPQQMLLPYCIYGFCFVSGMCLMNFTTALYYTQENYFLPNFIWSIVNLIFILFIPQKGTKNTETDAQQTIYMFFATYLVAGLITYLSFFIRNYDKGAITLPSKEHLSKFFRYALTAVTANVIFFLVYRIDYLFVNKYCQPQDLGNYIQVSKLGQMMIIVPQIIASVVFPRTASGDTRMEMNATIMMIARLFSQLYLIIFIVVLLLGNLIFVSVFGETFNNMQWPMLLVLPGIFALSVLAMLAAYFSGKGNLKVNLRGAALALVVMITGDFIFVPKYGILAAAAVSTVSYCVNLAFSFSQFYKDYSVHFTEFFKWKKSDYKWLFKLLRREE